MGLAFLITAERLQLLGERKVLKEAEYAAVLDASAVIDVARAEAARIGEQATAEAIERCNAGYRDGLQQGQQAYARKLVEDSLAMQRQLQDLRSAMAQIVVKAVAQFIADAEPHELFEAALLRVDSLLRKEPFVTVRVAPAREPGMRRALETLGTQAAWVANVLVVADPALGEGACLVQTASGTLEIGVDAQIDAFRSAVERAGPGRLQEVAL
jgi:type III secretion protein L